MGDWRRYFSPFILKLWQYESRRTLFMYRLGNLLFHLNIWRQSKGQDLIEYALMAGFVAVAAGAIMPGVSVSISQIFSKVASVLSSANG
jgi:pilus assembly protein Flp/PilA